jgi:transposase
MTKLLNIEGVTVKSYQIIENIGITIYLDNNNQKAICPDCGKKTDKLHQNHYYLVRGFAVWRAKSIFTSKSPSDEV